MFVGYLMESPDMSFVAKPSTMNEAKSPRRPVTFGPL